jgi:hypothetical protein
MRKYLASLELEERAAKEGRPALHVVNPDEPISPPVIRH